MGASDILATGRQRRECTIVRFVHSGDWQLGMTRHFLSAGEQERYSEARLDAVRALAQLATREECSFAVVCGDVFDSNLVDRSVVVRALDALRAFTVPVYLLPANHDPLNAASVYRSRTWLERCPAHVVVLAGADPVAVPNVAAEVVGAPWDSKQPLEDLAARACTGLPARPTPATARILVAHGAVDTLSPDKSEPSLIRLATAELALADGVVDYIALGDRHSVTEVGATGRIWYAGTPLVTDYTEDAPNEALVVTLKTDGGCDVARHAVGTWRFVRESFPIDGAEDVGAVEAFLEALPAKRETVVKLSFQGTVSLAEKARLDALLEHYADLFAALETWERHTDLVVKPDEDDLRDLGLSGFAAAALEEIRTLAEADGAAGQTAQDALDLLYRLARSGG